MSTQLTQAQILAKLKKQTKGAFSRAKDKEPVIKGNRLPSGIIRGIAKYSKGELSIDKDGVVRATITGIVVDSEPSCRGARARISKRFKSPDPGKPGKTIEQRMEEFLSDCQLLGVETSNYGSEDDIPAIFEELEQTKPYFYFNTWQPPVTKQDPDPDVFVFIQGLADDYIPDDEADIVVEEDGVEVETKSEDILKEEEIVEEMEEELLEEEELLGEEEEEWKPGAGDLYGFQFPKTAAPVTIEILVVDYDKKCVKIKRVSDQKVFANVAWDKLTDAPA